MKIEEKMNENAMICFKLFPENKVDKDFIKKFLDKDVSSLSGYRENNSYFFVKIYNE